MAHYPAGSFYKRHLDQFKERNNRVISTILYLNKNWEASQGGELKLFFDHEEKIVEPKYGRIVSFKSDQLEHEVLKTNVDRFSITGWMLHNPVGLGFLGNQ
jgi:SM-20-related protein